MEEKIKYLIEIVEDLRVQVRKLVGNELGCEEPLRQYLENKRSYHFSDVECEKALKDYLTFKDNINPLLPNITQNKFNKIIKNTYQDLDVVVTTRNRKSVRIFKRK